MKQLLFIATALTVLCYSCKKDKTTKPAPTPTTPPITHIGASFQGGIVVNMDITGQHGYIAAPTDQSTGIKWYDGFNTQIETDPGVWYDNVGQGRANTNLIVSAYGAGNYAAYMCDTLNLNGYSDWFLPSEKELLYIDNIYPGNAIGTNFYWSSTESGSGNSYALNCSLPSMSTNAKTLLRSVRAFRNF